MRALIVGLGSIGRRHGRNLAALGTDLGGFDMEVRGSKTCETFRWPIRVPPSNEAGLEAGEILLTSIDRDGTMVGYDIELTRRVSNAVSIPVIASGGAGNYQHMASVIIEGKASAVAVASMFHFTERNGFGG